MQQRYDKSCDFVLRLTRSDGDIFPYSLSWAEKLHLTLVCEHLEADEISINFSRALKGVVWYKEECTLCVEDALTQVSALHVNALQLITVEGVVACIEKLCVRIEQPVTVCHVQVQVRLIVRIRQMHVIQIHEICRVHWRYRCSTVHKWNHRHKMYLSLLCLLSLPGRKVHIV